jgi:hypothetical protein
MRAFCAWRKPAPTAAYARQGRKSGAGRRQLSVSLLGTTHWLTSELRPGRDTPRKFWAQCEMISTRLFGEGFITEPPRDGSEGQDPPLLLSPTWTAKPCRFRSRNTRRAWQPVSCGKSIRWKISGSYRLNRLNAAQSTISCQRVSYKLAMSRRPLRLLLRIVGLGAVGLLAARRCVRCGGLLRIAFRGRISQRGELDALVNGLTRRPQHAAQKLVSDKILTDEGTRSCEASAGGCLLHVFKAAGRKLPCSLFGR